MEAVAREAGAAARGAAAAARASVLHEALLVEELRQVCKETTRPLLLGTHHQPLPACPPATQPYFGPRQCDAKERSWRDPDGYVAAVHSEIDGVRKEHRAMAAAQQKAP